MTKFELREELEKIRSHVTKDIDYEHIHRIFKSLKWQWGGDGEPCYVPEYRDLKRHVTTEFDSLARSMMEEFTDPPRNIKGSNDYGNIYMVLDYDKDDDNVVFTLSIKSDVTQVTSYSAHKYPFSTTIN